MSFFQEKGYGATKVLFFVCFDICQINFPDCLPYSSSSRRVSTDSSWRVLMRSSPLCFSISSTSCSQTRLVALIHFWSPKPAFGIFLNCQTFDSLFKEKDPDS